MTAMKPPLPAWMDKYVSRFGEDYVRDKLDVWVGLKPDLDRGESLFGEDPEAELRTLRLAILHAEEAFARGDLGALATVNEGIQSLVDTAVRWGRELERAAAHKARK